jgi:membrane protein required for colicin V production
MNWLDIVLLLIVAASVFTSIRKGLAREVIGLVSVIVAVLAGIWFYGIPAGILMPYLSSRGLANFGGFFVVFCAMLGAGAIAGFVIGKFLRATGLSIFDRLLGAGFGLVRGTLIAVALIMGLMAFSATDRPPDAIVNSRFAPYVADAARVMAALAPYELKEGFRKTYAQARSAWEKTIHDGLRKAPAGGRKDHERKI